MQSRSLVMVAFTLAACGPSVAHSTAASRLAPADAFTCVLREIAKRDFLPATTERDAGLIIAHRGVGGMAGLVGNYRDEITAVVLPEEHGSTVKVSVARAKQERGAWTTNGMSVSGGLRDEGAAVQAACGGSA